MLHINYKITSLPNMVLLVPTTTRKSPNPNHNQGLSELEKESYVHSTQININDDESPSTGIEASIVHQNVVR